MLLEYIKHPKYISYSEYEVDSNSFKDDYFIKKEKEKVLLIQKDYYENNLAYFYYINDVAKEILNQYGKSIFALVSIQKENKKIVIYIGNTIDINNLNMFSSMEMNLEDMDNVKKIVSLKINTLKGLLKTDKVLVFLENSVNAILINEIFTKTEDIYDANELKNILSKTLCYEKSSKKNFPLVISSAAIFILFLITNHLIDSINYDNELEFNNKKSELLNNIQVEKQLEGELNKKIYALNEKISKTNLNNKFYLGAE